MRRWAQAGWCATRSSARLPSPVSPGPPTTSTGLGVAGVTASPLPGPAGNVEFFLWLRRDAEPLDPDKLRTAIEEGPQ